MKRVLIIAAGFALLAGPAWAQSPLSGSDRDGDRMERRDMGADRDWRGGWGWGHRDGGPRGPGGGWHDGRGHHGGHRQGAGFFFQRGDTRFAVRCDQQESMRDCVDAATTLLDRVRSLPTSGATGTPPASSGPGASP